MPVELIIGPPTREMSRTAAEQALVNNRDFPKDAEYTIQSHGEQWIAAIHHSAPPPPVDDEEEEAPPPSPGKSGPSDSAGPDDSLSDSDSGSSDSDSSGPPKAKDKGDGAEKGGNEIHQVLQLLHALCDALGIAPDAGASPVPGPDAPMAPPAPPPPHGGPAGGAPGGKGGLGMSPRPMKPGDTPPGGTPTGAPAFAKVAPDHPWAQTVGKVARFTVAEDIGGQDITEIHDELQSLARAGGFRVERFRPTKTEDGRRVAQAIIRTPQP